MTSSKRHKGIKCPKCGGLGPYRFVEEISCYREVYGFDCEDEPGVLQIEGLYQTGEGYDDGENGRMQCHSVTFTPLDAAELADLQTFPADNWRWTFFVERDGVWGRTGECLHSFPLPDDLEINWR
jgi:hypothetical protein